jgi:tRNA modification GTPase
LHVIDTAGLRDHPDVDEVERIGIARAWDQIGQADAVLFLHDLTRQSDDAYQAADADIETTLQQMVAAHVPVLHVWNKTDASQDTGADMATSQALAENKAQGEKADDRPFEATRFKLRMSARTGEGLPALREQLLKVVGWQGGSAEGLYMARERHVQALREVDTHLHEANACLQTKVPPLDLLAEELRLSQNALNTITGEFSSDDLLGVIFSSFCIGK